MSTRVLCVALISAYLASSAQAGIVYVNGAAPDWNQPYAYPGPNGPGPDPAPGVLNPWNAWCAPTSAANLVGHWQDTYGKPVADGFAFALSPAWGVVSWHDYEADLNRPAPNNGAPPITDIGYYMDTNRLGMIAANPVHAGTFVRDIDTGLLKHFNQLDPAGGWTTGTQGKGYAAGLASNGAPAAMHPNAGSAYAEIVNEINAGRTMIISWAGWNIVPAGFNPVGNTFFYDFMTYSGDPWGNDEVWNGSDGGDGLGHAVTAVGYLLANDLVNPQPGTNWIVVHDNVVQTPVDVAVPMNFNMWVANTNAVPEPGTLGLLLLGAAALRYRRFR